MNQYIQIIFGSGWDWNYQSIRFILNKKQHREKAPSWLDNDGDWEWWVKGNYENDGCDFNWNKN